MLLGRAHDLLGESEEPARYYEEFVRERLAQLHEDRGAWAEAAEQYGQIVRQRVNADPALQWRVEAAREGHARGVAREGLSPD
jgi:hypothetical protein